MKIAFIVNGINRKLKQIQKGIAEFENSGVADKVSTYLTEHVGHGIRLSKEACADHDIVVSVGGDGTANEVVNGIIQAGNDRLFGTLPYGTANDLSKTTGNTSSFKDLAELIRINSTKKIDLGLAHFYDDNAAESSRYFVNEIDLGIGGYVVEKVSKSKKRFGAKFSFMKAIFESLITYEQSHVQINSDELQWDGKLLSLAISNGKYFGSGIQIASDAVMDDGYFNCTLFSEIKTTDYIKHINKIRKGHKINHRGVRYFKTKNISITPKHLSCALDIDGEFCGFAPANISVIPKAIQILAPEV